MQKTIHPDLHTAPVVCATCGTYGPPGGGATRDAAEQAAARLWNTRPAPGVAAFRARELVE